MDEKTIQGAIEAILFAADEPLALSRFAAALELDKKTAEEHIKRLMGELSTNARGIQIIEFDGAYKMCTNPDYYPYLSALDKGFERQKELSQTLLETLAIIAHKQPVTKADIEAIRGVDASFAVNKLIEYNLVRERGRSSLPGRPILFGTTSVFQTRFGVPSPAQLVLPDVGEGLAPPVVMEEACHENTQ